MPTRPDDETKASIEKASVDVIQEVQSIGKATGAAIGWGMLITLHVVDIFGLKSNFVQYLRATQKIS
jgi:hypothetical protein